jgi:hypothetical protein
MPVLHDYYCVLCCNVETDLWEAPKCCGEPMRIAIMKVNSPEWGGPRTLIHLRDEPFESRSELNRYCRDNGLEQAPSADKDGGARNEDHLNLGKSYSYAGSPKS